MPRVYKPSGRKQYRKYDDLVMQAALKEYENSNKSLATISAKYNIPKSVLHRHNIKFVKKAGGQTVLNADVEKQIVEDLNNCAEWGFRLNIYNLRILVKGYLDGAGINIKRFKDNLPGPDFIQSFLRRNKDTISLKISQNIKRSRKSILPEVVEEQHCTELEKAVENLLMCNVINYNEKNLSNSPELPDKPETEPEKKIKIESQKNLLEEVKPEHLITNEPVKTKQQSCQYFKIQRNPIEENKDDILKKNCNIREYGKTKIRESKKKEKQDSEISMESSDMEKMLILNIVREDNLLYFKTDELDIDNTPLLFEDDIDVEKEIEINDKI